MILMATTGQISAYEKRLENLGARQKTEENIMVHGFRIGVDFATMHLTYVVFVRNSGREPAIRMNYPVCLSCGHYTCSDRISLARP